MSTSLKPIHKVVEQAALTFSKQFAGIVQDGVVSGEFIATVPWLDI